MWHERNIMKIEKINDNQIRCTLNKSDLTSRHLKISELVYGSDNARELFRDMMQQASYELGFEAEDIPLMIEAIPISAECIVLIVTKVEDPEELDTRFSRFSDESEEDEDYVFDNFSDQIDAMEEIPEEVSQPSATEELDSLESNVKTPTADTANDVINLFNKVKDYLNKSIEEASGKNGFVPLKDSLVDNKTSNALSSDTHKNTTKSLNHEPIMRVFKFDSFDAFSKAAMAVRTIYADINSLYKDPVTGMYYLVLRKTLINNNSYNKACNILSEYGNKENLNNNIVYFYDEHYDCIVKNRAIQTISDL